LPALAMLERFTINPSSRLRCVKHFLVPMQTRRRHRDPVAVRAVHCVQVSVHSKVRPVFVLVFLNLTMRFFFVYQ
jgi:hypothetical protein